MLTGDPETAGKNPAARGRERFGVFVREMHAQTTPDRESLSGFRVAVWGLGDDEYHGGRIAVRQESLTYMHHYRIVRIRARNSRFDGNRPSVLTSCSIASI
jgi:hypothetical protein